MGKQFTEVHFVEMFENRSGYLTSVKPFGRSWSHNWFLNPIALRDRFIWFEDGRSSWEGQRCYLKDIDDTALRLIQRFLKVRFIANSSEPHWPGLLPRYKYARAWLTIFEAELFNRGVPVLEVVTDADLDNELFEDDL